MTRQLIGMTIVLGTVFATTASADDWKSAQATRTLLQGMEASGADAVAVRDPERPERFIAALRLPGQLLVVSAAHPSVDLVSQRLAAGSYRDVYLDLQGTPARDSKFFVQDMAADGLSLSGRGEAFDVVYDGGATLMCDGRWKDAKLEKDAYHDMVAKADARYARMLGLLTGALGAVAPPQ